MAESEPQGGGTTEGNDNSDWMSKLPPRLQRVSLWTLAIPGKAAGPVRTGDVLLLLLLLSSG